LLPFNLFFILILTFILLIVIFNFGVFVCNFFFQFYTLTFDFVWFGFYDYIMHGALSLMTQGLTSFFFLFYFPISSFDIFFFLIMSLWFSLVSFSIELSRQHNLEHKFVKLIQTSSPFNVKIICLSCWLELT